MVLFEASPSWPQPSFQAWSWTRDQGMTTLIMHFFWHVYSTTRKNSHIGIFSCLSLPQLHALAEGLGLAAITLFFRDTLSTSKVQSYLGFPEVAWPDTNLHSETEEQNSCGEPSSDSSPTPGSGGRLRLITLIRNGQDSRSVDHCIYACLAIA